MNKSTIEQVQIIKQDGGALKVLFSIENASLNLVNMMHFGIFELLFKINVDICESYKMDVIDNENARLTLVLKHILKDLGLPQMWAVVRIVREDRENLVILTITHYSTGCNNTTLNDPLNDPLDKNDEDSYDEYEQIPLKSIVVQCDTTNPHKIDICIDVFYNDATSIEAICGDFAKPAHNIQNFVDKMIKTLIKNIINRLKQFIEKMPYTSNQLNTR
jgi:hypothetical protein